MSLGFPLSTTLRDLIGHVRQNRQSPAELEELKTLTRAMALASLKRKKSYGSIHPGLFKLSLAGLADSCVEDLFGTDEKAVPPELRESLAAFDLAAASDQELLMFLRRLVFTRVNAVVLRVYAEADPVLGEIIRELQFCAGTLGIFAESERFGIPMLTPVLCKPYLHRPIFTFDELVNALRRLSLDAGRFHAAMARLSLYLRSQSERACAVPLVTLAVAYRWHLLTAEDPPHDTSS